MFFQYCLKQGADDKGEVWESRWPILLVLKCHDKQARNPLLSSLKVSALHMRTYCCLPSVTAFSPSTWIWLYLGSSTRHYFLSCFSLLSPWTLLTRLLQLCSLSSFRRCVEVTPAEIEELKGVRPWLRQLTSFLNPCKQRNKDTSAPFPYMHLLREHRPITPEPDRYQFFN